MSGTPSTPLARQGQLLKRILKMVRKERRLTQEEVAESMRMPLRTYQEFERGVGALDLRKLRLFARATRSDPVALQLALFFKRPEVALYTLDSKLPMTFWVAFFELLTRVGPRLNIVPPGLVLSGMRRMTEEIDEHLARHAASAESFLEKAWADIYSDDIEDAEEDVVGEGGDDADSER
ncbi:helix-turn-helix transcriptional regulator [Caulobacter sp.]|uniref:helix-turn-helix domain-containing protein n=1 Tax=Caulobacter sp. TaxID=78 RepID=UPI0031E39E8C